MTVEIAYSETMLRKAVMIIGLVILLLIIAYIGGSFYAANALTSPTVISEGFSPTHIANQYEDVTFPATDGVKLSGWLFKAPSQKLVILVTGVKSTRVNTGYYGIGVAKELLAQGYNVLVYDTRGNGDSQKSRVSYGIFEGNDVEGAVAFAKSRGFDEKRIGIIANSMGTFSVITHIAKLPVGAIVLDSPAAFVQPVIAQTMKRENGVPYFLDPGIFFFTKLLYKIDIPSIRPIDHIGNAKIPLLLLHGDQDITIPLNNSEELMKKAPADSKLVVFKGTEHVESYKHLPDLYRTEVYGYLSKMLR